MKFTKEMKAINYILMTFLTLIISVGSISAQVSTSRSRLDIGTKPNTPSAPAVPVTPYINKGKVNSSIKVNQNAALNAFYRDLLLNKSTVKTNIPVKTVNYTAEKTTEDKLYNDNNITVSNVYPNPASEYAHFDYRLNDSRQQAKLSVINLLGKTLDEYSLNPNENKLSISTRQWDNGVYFYQLILDGKKVATKKLIVRHQ